MMKMRTASFAVYLGVVVHLDLRRDQDQPRHALEQIWHNSCTTSKVSWTNHGVATDNQRVGDISLHEPEQPIFVRSGHPVSSLLR